MQSNLVNLMATFEEASNNDFSGNNRDSNSNQQLLSTEYGDNTIQADNQCCGICRELACDPLITNKCCNQIFCSKCLKDYLKDTENDITMPCPYCNTKGFTYAPLDMKVLHIIKITFWHCIKLLYI